MAGPFDKLLTLFDSADLIVAYNGLDFDFPLLRKHYGYGKQAQARYVAHRCKCHDPFAQCRAATDVWFKLDALLQANHMPSKAGDGLLAIKLWEQQKREELLEYCRSDVELLTQLVFMDTVVAPGVGQLPNTVCGVRSALAWQRAIEPLPLEGDYVIVSTGDPVGSAD